jgi:photosystem II stability/assembly factor-like uncharacterized protein
MHTSRLAVKIKLNYMKISIYPFLLMLIASLLISCQKNNPPDTRNPGNNTNTNPGVDTLNSWKLVGTVSGASIDIWFVSPARGFIAHSSSQILGSADSGKTWMQIPNSQTARPTESLFFTDDQHGFAANNSELLITSDGGDHWNFKAMPAGDINGPVFFVSSSTGYAASASLGVFKTADTGNSWVNIYHPVNSTMNYYNYFLDPNNGWIISSDGNVANTTNAASTWQPLASQVAPKADSLAWNTVFFTDIQTGYYATQAGLLKTIDGGSSWTVSCPQGGNVNIIQFTDANTGYYLTNQHIYKTSDAGKTWTMSCFINPDSFLGMHFINNETGWACTLGGRIFRITP